MVVGPDTSRDVVEADHDEIDALLRSAFDTDGEAQLVRQLRADGDMWFEIKKPWLGQIAGYFAVSRMLAPVGWACLAPVAVRPDWQGGRLVENNPNWIAGASHEESYRHPWRVGSRMMRELGALIESPHGLENLPKCIVVLGKPSFYERAGFSRVGARNLISPYPIRNTMILGLGDEAPREKLIYPKAFDGI